jgi:RHS repeat-associated protein
MRRKWSQEHRVLMPVACAVMLLAVGAAVGLGANTARGDESAAAPEALGPTAQQTKEALEAAGAGRSAEPAETDLRAAEELPHRDLGREEALELVEGVFGAQLEEPAGVYSDIEAKKFLSDHAAVVPSSTLAEVPGGEGGQVGSELPPEGSVLLESSLPLRVENDEGEEEAVDLNLESPEGAGGALEPTNPLVEVEAPAHLGEGITLPGPEVGIRVDGAPEEQTPSDVEGDYAFYPNVAQDTDLAVAPTATGVDVMTDIRSAEAPLATTYELSLPTGADLRSGPAGSAEVVQGEKRITLIPPPTATDAAGEPVPATQRIEGDELTVAISPTPSTQFPILVDPTFVDEMWNWTYLHESQAAWTPSNTTPGFGAFPYALWEAQEGNPNPAPGLDLSSAGWGNAPYGGQALWGYTVPRYNEDYGHGYPPPTTWIYQLWTENVWFRTYGNSGYWPAMIIGLADPGSSGWWTTDHVWTGYQGDMYGNYFETNNYSDHATKVADFAYVTYEAETPAKHRDSYIGAAAVAVVDEEPPTVPVLTAPTGWLTGSAAKFIQFSAEDTGLGIRSASARLARAETQNPFWMAYLECWGTAISPCPRKAVSGESKVPSVPVVPSELPTGRDILEVSVADPLGHTAIANVAVLVDNTAPEISLSGPLTEQEKLGITKSEYPLAISVSDGSEDDPSQSGVASVEVKVDGKKVTMPKEELWHPACKTQDCPFTGGWTLKASEYAPGDHEVEVVATDAVGHTATETLEVELGSVPPQTSFSSPHPTYEAGGLPTISFKATKAGVPVEGATFKCSIDGATASTCTAPYELPAHFKDGWHTFTVAATDKGGVSDPTPATWRFTTAAYPQAPKDEKLVYPEVGKKTASYYTLEAQWGENPEGKPGQGVSGVSFQMELPGWGEFRTVPAECTVDGQGRQVSWPLPAHSHPGHDAPVYLKVRGCPVFEAAGYPEKEIQFRAVFDGSEAVAGASEPAATEFVSRVNANRVSTDATESVGPATVDLLTGAFTLSRTDVSIPIPGYEANLEFTRTYSSTVDTSEPGFSKVLGGAWQPASPLESEYGGEAWTRVEEKEIPYHPEVRGYYCWTEHEVEVGEEEFEMVESEAECPASHECHPEWCEWWVEEEEQPREVWVELINNEGAGVPFEIKGKELVAPEYAQELSLRRVGEAVVLAYPNGTHTTFSLPEGTTWQEGKSVFLPSSISYQANANSMRTVYKTEAGSKQLHLTEEISPTPVGGAPCEENETARKTAGCRSLVFGYGPLTVGYQVMTVLKSISYYGPGGTAVGQVVAEYSYGAAQLENGELVPALISEKDPRLPVPAEKYAYAEPSRGNLLTSLTPAGQEPWSFEYLLGHQPGRPEATRLKSVGRVGKKTTIAYEVPVKGSGAPYNLSPETVATWGETELPVDATAIFPPNHPPAEYPPHEYTGATIDYMDPEGYEINTASPSPPGVSGQSITTSETNVHGDVVRELSARNRLAALGSPEPVTRSHELDSHSIYSADGNEMLESWGPLHEIRLASGEAVQARRHTVTRYDEGEPTPAVGTPWAYLPTKETVSAVVSGKEGELEPRVTETHYQWKLRKPEETIVDPGGLAIRSITHYNAAGQVEETRQPKASGGGGAGDTRTIYWSAGGTGYCEGHPAYANLPCRVLPAKQIAAGGGRFELPVKTFNKYDELGEPEEILESPGGGAAGTRKTVVVYDNAGRQVTTRITGGGTELARTEAKTETVYSPTLGAPTTQRFVCQAKECTGFNSRATNTTYNTLGQVTKYEDADGATTETTYDAYGRPATVKDPRGTETMHYDETSGLLTSMEVSGVGTFTGAYDADGDLIERGLPNGLTAKTTYNQADEPTELAYTKTSSCGESCTWYKESLERSIEGGVLSGTSSLVSDRYSYDKAGRLTEAQETPAGGECTSRSYTYDADSNRLTKTTRNPGIGGVCATSGGTTQKYEYDEADRLIGPTYDEWGRITSLPAEFGGGKALTTSYFANDMVATQTQNGVTNTFQLDATGRQRQREQTGGVSGTEIFHYDGPGDSPSWTALGSTWSRNVTGIGGELAAVQESSGTTTFKLTDLHGDVVASASSSPTATKLLATYRSDEFGEPESGSAGRFGWLGGKSRRTELSSGVIQMGVRSYIPQIGRFLSPDPVPGGSANAYDYANANPVTGFDLLGESPSGHACYQSSIGCECKLWAHLKKGAHKGTVTLTVVQKCNRFGGISKRGEEVRWESRTPHHGSYHSIPPLPPVYPRLEPACIGDANTCQNDRKYENTLHCEPGKEIQYTDVWAFQFNYQGNGEIHNLQVTIQQTCPG